MKTFMEDPLRILLAIFAGVGMLRSILALLEAVTNEPARMRTAGLYLIIFIAIFLGAYLIIRPSPSAHRTSGNAEDETSTPDEGKPRETAFGMRVAGAILLTLASSLVLNSWLMPYLSLAPVMAPTETPTQLASETPLATPTRQATATIHLLTPTFTPSPTPIRTLTPTPMPAGIRMQVILPRVHVRLEPTSKSASIGELNNGDRLYFDGRTLDAEGTLWLRIGPDQPETGYQRLVGYWVFAGGLDPVGVDDLPLLPATATPAG